MKQMKKGFMILLFAMMITSTVGSMTSIFASVNYNKREQIAKKNLEKKVRTMLENPYCYVRSSKRKGRILTCQLVYSMGEGGGQLIVKVNLNTGVATIVFDDVGDIINEYNGRWDDEKCGYVGKYKFKIKVK